MKQRIDANHPLVLTFGGLVHDAVAERVDAETAREVEGYLTGLLIDFMHTDRVFALQSRDGRPIRSVFEMMAEGDVRLNADSFERERQVHKHIGDYILFWSGIYPEFLRRLKLDSGHDLICDYTRQGKASYYVVSTFDYEPYTQEATTFRKLSEGFEEFSVALTRVRRELPLDIAS